MRPSSALGETAGISALPIVLDPATIAEHLQWTLPDRPEAARDVRVEVLKHHAGRRCTVEIAVRTGSGWSHLIGKVYATDRSDVYRAMEEISRAGFGPADELAIPRPLAYVPALNLLLQEKVEGHGVKQMFLTGPERDRARTSKRCARWLAKFHTVGPRSGPRSDQSSHLASLHGWSETLARLGEPVATRARRLAEGLRERPPSPGGMRAGHGSYSCNQIVVAGDRTVTFDWDGYDAADPSRDVARFVVALQRLGLKYLGSIQALDAAIEAFLEVYGASSECPISASLSWFRALTCLKLAKYEANRQVNTFPGLIEALLAEGARVLER